MSIATVLQSLLVVSCAGLGATALSIRSKVRTVEPLPVQDAESLISASTLTTFSLQDRQAHRHIYAYRVDALLPCKCAREELQGLVPPSVEIPTIATPTTTAETAAATATVIPTPKPHTSFLFSPSPSIGSLYALHALESAFPFRVLWMWQTFRDTYRVSDTFNVWWRTRPARMANVREDVARAASQDARDQIIQSDAAEVEALSDMRYEALLESGSSQGAVIRGGPRLDPVADTLGVEVAAAALTAMEAPSSSPMYGAWFDLRKAETDQPASPRAAPLYILYVSAPYSAESPRTTWERVRLWKDDWCSRWYAAHVVKALAEM